MIFGESAPSLPTSCILFHGENHGSPMSETHEMLELWPRATHAKALLSLLVTIVNQTVENKWLYKKPERMKQTRLYKIWPLDSMTENSHKDCVRPWHLSNRRNPPVGYEWKTHSFWSASTSHAGKRKVLTTQRARKAQYDFGDKWHSDLQRLGNIKRARLLLDVYVNLKDGNGVTDASFLIASQHNPAKHHDVRAVRLVASPWMKITLLSLSQTAWLAWNCCCQGDSADSHDF